MKNFASANKYLSAAFALAAIVAAGTVPAAAQSRDHTGSMMPFYYDATGGQKTGSWSKEEEAGTANSRRRTRAAALSICGQTLAASWRPGALKYRPVSASSNSGNDRVVRFEGAGATVSVGRARAPTRSKRPLSLPLSLGVIDPHPHVLGATGPRSPARWALSRDSSTRRYDNVEQDNNRAGRRNRSRHRVDGIGRDRASSRQRCQSGDL